MRRGIKGIKENTSDFVNFQKIFVICDIRYCNIR